MIYEHKHSLSLFYVLLFSKFSAVFSYVGEFDMDQSLQSGATFYKLEMLNIQIVSAYGNQACLSMFSLNDLKIFF